MVTYTLKVVEVRQETIDTVTIAFKQPGLKKIKYKAGQYLTVIFRINNRRYIRPYSFSSAPGIDPHLEITVKRVPEGIVSNHICDTVKEGDVIEVMEPLGDFVISDQVENRNIVLWGAGSGITPLFSIVKSLLSSKAQNHVTLVYGNRNNETVIFDRQIRELEVAYPANFSVWHFHTRLVVDEEHPYLIQGRIQPEKVLSVMIKEQDITNTIHYVCGPAGLKESVKKSLQEYNISIENFFSEDFELVKDEKYFEDIFTRTIRIIKEGQQHSVEVVKGRSILEAGLDASIEMPYSCQTGSCSVCRGKVLSGKVRQIIKRHDDLLEDEYQLCCTYPLTDDVIVIA
jgi:ring-1,2-phenylacetyl-CoA epoxidase subunit PaaE